MKMFALAVFFVLSLAGCSSTNADNVPLSLAEIPVPDNTSIVSSGDMRISPLDMLEVKVFNSTGMDGTYQADMDGTYQVDPAGQIKMPLVGSFEVKGYTAFELGSLLESKLREYHLRNPQVAVRIAESNGQQFTIEGAIDKPGMYPVRGRLSLLQAIALSGGPTPSANLSGIIIFRTIEGTRQAARFDLTKIRIGESIDPAIYGNDVVVVDGQLPNQSFDGVLRSLPVVGMFVGLLAGPN